MQALRVRLIAIVKDHRDRPTKPKETYWLTRFVLLRLLGFVYLFAWLSLALQVRALIGHHGILSADLFLQKLQAYGAGFWQMPSLFWFGLNDTVLVIGAWTGAALSITILPVFSLFDDAILARFLPGRLAGRAKRAKQRASGTRGTSVSPGCSSASPCC